MSKKKVNVQRIPGDTIAERKREARKFLDAAQVPYDRIQIKQIHGVLWIRWLAPFPEQFLERLEGLAKHGRVCFVPDPSIGEVGAVEFTFEREPELLFYHETIEAPVIVRSMEHLPQLLHDFQVLSEKMQQEREHASLPEAEPEQKELWED